jgi:hypothetical protein
MREATEALTKRRFGEGAVYNIETPGAWKDSAKVRSRPNPITEEVTECIALQAQYIYNIFIILMANFQLLFRAYSY